MNVVDDCQNDLPALELTSRSGVVQKLDLIKNPSKTTEVHFEQDNLLPGKYSGTSPFDDQLSICSFRSFSCISQIQTNG